MSKGNNNMRVDATQEKKLERKYQGVLNYADAKQFLDATPYTAAKINGAIKRFCNSESVEKPRNFVEMETFVSDLSDFWLDNNPEVHTQGESILHSALSNYVAFTTVWKYKSKSSSIYVPELMAKCGVMIVVKNGLGNAIKVVNSYAKRNPELSRQDIVDGLIDGFSTLLPMIASNKLPEPSEPLTRLLGAYLAGNKNILDAVEGLKQIEAA